jgi:hypothetical protein
VVCCHAQHLADEVRVCCTLLQPVVVPSWQVHLHMDSTSSLGTLITSATAHRLQGGGWLLVQCCRCRCQLCGAVPRLQLDCSVATLKNSDWCTLRQRTFIVVHAVMHQPMTAKHHAPPVSTLLNPFQRTVVTCHSVLTTCSAYLPLQMVLQGCSSAAAVAGCPQGGTVLHP